MYSALPHPVDIHVGARIRVRRKMLGCSQKKLGNAVGVSFQQVQKYESGINRVGASRLFELAEALEVSVVFFFEGLEDGSSTMITSADSTAMSSALLLQAIANPEHKKAIDDLIRVAADQSVTLID